MPPAKDLFQRYSFKFFRKCVSTEEWRAVRSPEHSPTMDAWAAETLTKLQGLAENLRIKLTLSQRYVLFDWCD